MNQDGAYLGNTQQAFAPRWCIFVFSVLVSGKDFVEIRPDFQPRRAPRERPLGTFQLAESVIVGNTLPAEVSVSPASILKEVMPYFQG